VSDEGALTTELILILDHRIRKLRCRTVDQVKVQWDNYSPYSTTWEDAYDMHQQLLFFLFDRETYDTVIHIFFPTLIYYETLGISLYQEWVYVTSHSCAHCTNLFFEDTFLQVIQIIILLVIDYDYESL
jgi:hypothetical protein